MHIEGFISRYNNLCVSENGVNVTSDKGLCNLTMKLQFYDNRTHAFEMAETPISWRSPEWQDRIRFSYDTALDKMTVRYEGVDALKMPDYVQDDEVRRHKKEVS